MSEMTPRDNRTVLFPEPLRRTRGLNWFAIGAIALAVVVGLGWRMTDSAADDVESTGSAVPVRARQGTASVPAVAAAPAPARTPARERAPGGSLVDVGVRAYEAASYDTAATVLRRSLHGRGADSLHFAQRSRAMTYLAAAELLRGRRDSADAAFRQLLRDNPRARPDAVEFPAAVIARYAKVRAALHGVAKIRTTTQGVALLVVAFTPHRAGVGVRTADGHPLMTLFDGVVRDSVVVRWDGVGPDSLPAPLGSYDLVLIAFGKDGGMTNAVSFPVLMQQPDSAARPRPRSVASPTPTSPPAGPLGRV